MFFYLYQVPDGTTVSDVPESIMFYTEYHHNKETIVLWKNRIESE
jgi:hypothetical protein